MRIICVGFYKLTLNIITTRDRTCPWSETPQNLEKSSLLLRAKSLPFHKSAACISGIDEPPNSGAAKYRDNSTRIDRRRITEGPCASHCKPDISRAQYKLRLRNGNRLRD